MEVMSDDFIEFLDLLNHIGEIIVVDDRTKLFNSDRRDVLTWFFLRTSPFINYYEDKKKKRYAIQIGNSVYLLGIGYIRHEPFIIASKRDRRSLKQYTEVRKKDSNDSNN